MAFFSEHLSNFYYFLFFFYIFLSKCVLLVRTVARCMSNKLSCLSANPKYLHVRFFGSCPIILLCLSICICIKQNNENQVYASHVLVSYRDLEKKSFLNNKFTENITSVLLTIMNYSDDHAITSYKIWNRTKLPNKNRYYLWVVLS